jgi:Mor family transcriptional regulator
MRVHTVVMAKLIGVVADRLAADPRVPTENRLAYREAVCSVFSEQLASMFGGEEVRFYVPKAATDLRIARDERIAAALAAGESASDVAKREQLSERHVRRVRGRIGGY